MLAKLTWDFEGEKLGWVFFSHLLKRGACLNQIYF